MQKIHLNHKHAHTLQQIFQHPVSHNLEWREVVALIKEVGTVQEENDGHLTFTVNGITEVFRPTQDKKDVSEVDQVMRLRHLMEAGGVTMDGTNLLAGDDAPGQESLSEHGNQAHDKGHVNAEQNRHAEQQLKTQEHEQNDRSAFMAGNAQSHQQGNRQK